ncbi:MAG TPA: chorismate mutase [Candidatus Elarobacter sp.]|nr:chorismate mutase [Candidatus Elarobacter sp.]
MPHESIMLWQERLLAPHSHHDDSTSQRRLHAIRGAITVREDDPSRIHGAARELVTEMAALNGISPRDVVSVIFTVTPDLRSVFPATGVRVIPGWSAVPLLCASEIDVPHALPRCIRALVHAYAECSRGEIRHAYLGDARVLRPDLGDGDHPALP